VAEAKATLAAANEKKAEVDLLVADLNAKLQVLLDAFDKVMKERNDAVAAAEKCEKKMNLATRLVGALGAELDRWTQSILDLSEYLKVIIGDVLLASAFVSYVGPFNKKFRDMIVYENFVEFFKTNNIPMSATPNPLIILTDEAKIAGWNTFGLPPDQVSTENGAILTNSDRYSLIIDP
jgi:dynein heavy chain